MSWPILGLLVLAAVLWPPTAGQLRVEPGGPMRPGLRTEPGTGQPAHAGVVDPGAPRSGRPSSGGVSALEVAAIIELMCLALASGQGIVAAVEAVCGASAGVVQRRLATVVAAVRWGVPWLEAWSLVGREWRRVGVAFALADDIGIAPTAPLQRAASDVRAAVRQDAALAAARLGVRLVLPLGLAFLPAFVLLTVVPLIASLAGQVWRG